MANGDEVVVDCREEAPAAAHRDMYKHNPGGSTKGVCVCVWLCLSECACVFVRNMCTAKMLLRVVMEKRGKKRKRRSESRRREAKELEEEEEEE